MDECTPDRLLRQRALSGRLQAPGPPAAATGGHLRPGRPPLVDQMVVHGLRRRRARRPGRGLDGVVPGDRCLFADRAVPSTVSPSAALPGNMAAPLVPGTQMA